MPNNRFITLFALSALFICLNSCTVLQWRDTDQEIYDKFSKKNIDTSVSYFTVDSLDLKVRIQEVKAANASFNLVYLHGSPSSMSAWNGYLTDSLLTSVAHSYTIDRPGYGYSNFGDEIPSIETQSQILSAAITDKNLKNVITIGSSYGGPIAARIALLNPAVKGVIMVSPAIDPNNEQKIWQSKLTQWWLTRWLSPTAYRVAGDEKTVHAAELAKIASDWHKLTVPIVHIHGDVDDLVPYENIEYSQTVFSNLTIITTPDTGHEIAWARPELIKPHILKMINLLEEGNH